MKEIPGKLVISGGFMGGSGGAPPHVKREPTAEANGLTGFSARTVTENPKMRSHKHLLIKFLAERGGVDENKAIDMAYQPPYEGGNEEFHEWVMDLHKQLLVQIVDPELTARAEEIGREKSFLPTHCWFLQEPAEEDVEKFKSFFEEI